MNKKLNIHYFQHVPFESPAYIEEWAIQNGHKFSGTHFYRNDNLPDINEIDWLVIMGGPMNIYEEEKYPWLVEEKKIIKQAIDNDKVVIGICLGAQLIADSLGSKIYKNDFKEIGWFPVHLTQKAKEISLVNFLPDVFLVFHWHGETFDLPDRAVHIAESEACKNQAFIYKDKVIALQFHLEMTAAAVEEISEEDKSELVKDKFVQTEEEIKSNLHYASKANEFMNELMNRLAKTA